MTKVPTIGTGTHGGDCILMTGQRPLLGFGALSQGANIQTGDASES